ncbi:DUF4329 domain-containing protein [Pseudomonas sp. Xaverov 259]|uniref:DUF4329 domain-containing protein n=1 Tax=Pseudomonas sp. Xaverov 259 TaxID=2666086 RepID=UPI001C5AE947|nr:DUF4329 domain-containing protein [Pseudomonas sp. Xaverov 259]
MTIDLSREKRAALPALVLKLGTLSPAFVSADDTALYIHEQIGSRRTVEYGSVILQRLADQRFVASEPIADRGTVFNWTKLLERDSSTKDFLHPPGYRIVGCLHSHPDRIAATQQQNPKWTSQQVETFVSFFSVEDITFLHQERGVFGVVYLSGPKGTLLKYEHSGSVAESDFVQWLATTGPWESPHAYDGTIEGLYKKYASVGRLTFLATSSAWGNSLGAVPDDWAPYAPFASVSEQVVCGHLLETEEATWSYAQKQLDRSPTSQRLVFILKSTQGNEYLASKPRVIPANGLPPDYWFPGLTSGPKLPAGFHLHGFYFNGRPATQGVPTIQSWLYQNFFRPAELSRYIAKVRQYGLEPEAESVLGLVLYMRTPDGALLQYEFSGSPAETLLMEQDKEGAAANESLQAQLLAGTLSPRQYVTRVAAAGSLSVVQISHIWDTVGEVGLQWRPLAKMPKPVMSPAFITADDAACWAHEAIGTQRDLEYGGVILKRGYRYYATHPIAGKRVQFDHWRMLATDDQGKFIAPDDYAAEAFYHSHPADAENIKVQIPHFTADQGQVFNNFYSSADQLFSFEKRTFAKVHYLSGPDDVLLKYVSSGSAIEKKLDLQLRGGPGETSSDFEHPIRMLAEAGELSVVIANPVWGGVRGRISKGWRIRTAATAQPQQPFFTEAFSRPEHAVMRALVLAGPDDSGAKFGFVLKHTREDIYAATLAVPKSEPLFSPVGIFPKRRDGELRLPSQYRLEAIYFNSWYETNEISARETWLASAFFTPSQVVAATRQARATLAIQNPARGLTLYMHASDSALLAFKVPEATATSELVQESSSGALHDNGAQAGLLDGTLSPRTYVRRVISATDLSVVQPGGLWGDVGPVGDRLLVSDYTATLSRSFLSARDAAVYAHEQIGNRRDRYYGGYVLKGEDGRFVITEPIESHDNPFLYTLFFPVSHRGPLIPPQSYVLHGRYGSHLELSMADPVPIVRRGWTRDEALINQQVFSCTEMYSIIPAGRVAYLSAAPNCLLEYTPNKSSAETTLLANVSPQAGDHSLQRRLDSGQVKPAEWVRRLAEAGDFNVIQGNPLWGPRSVIYADWEANYTYAPRSGPLDYVTHGGVFTRADDAARDLHGRVHGRNFPQEACYAFILKHKDKEEYVASEVVGASRDGDLFNRFNFYKLTALIEHQLPDGFVQHGLFRSQQWVRAGLNASTEWLTRFFVTPQTLHASLYEANRGSAKSLPIYFSTLDGALLRYKSVPLDLTVGGPAAKLLSTAESQLNSGQLQPRDFIRAWAPNALHVVRTSQCWDEQGVVAKTWAGYQNLMPRSLSPAFANPDDAACYAESQISHGSGRAYGGVILRLAGGLFASTAPLAIPPQGFALNWIFPDQAVTAGLYPGNSTIVARYRSLTDQEVPLLLSTTQKAIYLSMIPSAVLSRLLHREAHIKREYVFGFDGSVLSYQLSGSAEELLLMKRLAALNLVKGDYADNSVEQQIRSGALTPLEFVTEVAKAGELSVVKGDRVWGQPRRIRGELEASKTPPNPGDIRQVLFDSPCGPIFTRALDAVRYAQRMAKPQADVSFGYVLKAVKQSLYMTTLPLVREEFDDFRRVFINGQLPQGYVLDGMYLCASNVAIAPASDGLSQSFFAPQYIGKALRFLFYARNGKTLALYLLCADGALLKYLVQRTASLYDWTSTAAVERTQLLEGTLTVRDYVRRLATRGELYVRVTSDVWGRKERVTGQWEPYRAFHAFADDPHFHSFCGPLFLYPDDAARYAQGLVAPFLGKQYLGAVLMPDQIQGYVAIDPVEDQRTAGASTRELLFWIDHAGFDVPASNVLSTYKIAAVQAFYQTMPSTSSRGSKGQGLLNKFLSKDDLRDYLSVIKSNAPDAKSCYFSSQGGALLKYVPAFTSTETTLLSPGGAPDPCSLILRLRSQGSLSVLVVDAFWTRLGVVGNEWNCTPEPSDSPNSEFWYERNNERDRIEL